MRVEISPKLLPRRGVPVEVGNVYANNRPPAFKSYRIVVGLANHEANGRRKWNNVICIHVDSSGEVVGCSAQPHNYVKDHWDLVGRTSKMPTIKIEWLAPTETEKTECPPEGSKSTLTSTVSATTKPRRSSAKGAAMR